MRTLARDGVGELPSILDLLGSSDKGLGAINSVDRFTIPGELIFRQRIPIQAPSRLEEERLDRDIPQCSEWESVERSLD